MEQPVSLPGQSDSGPDTPKEVPGSSPHTLPTLVSSAPNMAWQTLVEEINDLLCLGASHT